MGKIKTLVQAYAGEEIISQVQAEADAAAAAPDARRNVACGPARADGGGAEAGAPRRRHRRR